MVRPGPGVWMLPGMSGHDYRVAFAADAQLSDAARILLEVWRAAAMDRMPARREIRTASIAAYSRKIAFFDLVRRPDGSTGYRIRFSGADLDERFGCKPAADVVDLPATRWKDTALCIFEEARRHQAPLLTWSEQGVADTLLHARVRHLVLPLSEDGVTVSGLMLYSEFEPREAAPVTATIGNVASDPDLSIIVDPTHELLPHQVQLVERWTEHAGDDLPTRRLFQLLQSSGAAARMSYIRAQLMPNGTKQLSVLFFGSELSRRYGDLTGEIAHAESSELCLRRFHALCRQAIRSRRPVIGCSSVSVVRGQTHPWNLRVLVLPISENGSRVTGLIIDIEEVGKGAPIADEKPGNIYGIIGSFRAGESDRQTLIRQLCANIIQNVGATRVSIWRISEAEDSIHCDGLMDRRDATFTEGAVLHENDFQSYFDAIRMEGKVVASEARLHPATSCFNDTYFEPNDIHSLLDHVIIRDGRQTAILCCEHCGEIKSWTSEHMRYLALVSAQIGNHI